MKSIDAKTFLEYAVKATRRYGFVSKREADESNHTKTSTVSVADAMLLGSQTGFVHPGLELPVEPEQEDIDRAGEILSWLDTCYTENDFLAHCKFLVEEDRIDQHGRSYIAALVGAYEKMLMTRLADTPNSLHVGTSGDKLDLTLTCTGAVDKPSSYGGTFTIHNLVDKYGNAFTWLNGKHRLTKGTVIEATFTVKSHKQWAGVKQTDLKLSSRKPSITHPCGGRNE